MYALGLNGEYQLSDDAVNHIISGDLTERLYDVGGVRNAGKLCILKGGLHTVSGWLDFKKKHPELKHVYHFDSNADPYWYYARELQNGVVCLKLPKELFQSKAARITMFPDERYKSGYLWKTLFPENFTKEKIIEVINEALLNLDVEESSDSQLIGYALCDDPMTAMRVVIQTRENKIQSAYPAWTQPSTGNNGKPYAHAENIGYICSASTLFFDDDRTKPNIQDSEIFDENEGLFSIVANTPGILLSRKIPLSSDDKIEWGNSRRLELMNYAGTASQSDLSEISRYVTDVAVCKYNYEIMLCAYQECLLDIRSSHQVNNAFAFTQNIIDCIDVLFFFDQFKQSDFLVKASSYLLLNQLTSTGGLDSLNKKRIHVRILKCISMHHDNNSISQYLEDLSVSPVRKELFQEFNLNSYFKKSLDPGSDEYMTFMDLIVCPDLSFSLSREHLIGYIKNQLPINYHFYFDGEENERIVEDIIENYGANHEDVVSDNLVYANCKEFEFINGEFERLVGRVVKDSITIDSNVFNKICRDYCRIQYTQRLNLAFIFKEEFSYDIDYMNPQDEFYLKQMIAKHERLGLTINLDMFLDTALQLGNHLNAKSLVENIAAFKESIAVEQPPFLNRIPDYIDSWEKHESNGERDLRDIVSN